MTLPNPGMSFTPFDPLPAADLNDMVENIEAIANLSVFANGDIPRNLVANQGDGEFDYIVSGLVWTPDAAGSTLLASMSSGVVYINGLRVPISAVANRAFTASRDTYIDVGVDGVVDYNPVTNNSASPALAANHMRIGIIVTGASNIAAAASINQGQEDRVLPIASSVAYTVTDSLGNLIAPRDKNRRLLGYRQTTVNQVTTSATAVIVPGLSMPIIIPAGSRKVKLAVQGSNIYYSVGGTGAYNSVGVYDTSVAGTLLGRAQMNVPASSGQSPFRAETIRTVAAGSKTYVAGFYTNTAAAGIGLEAAPTYPLYIPAELM